MATRKPIIVAATAEHLAAVAPRLRAADRAEARAATGLDPHTALAITLALSEQAYAGFADDEPLGLFGVVRPSLLSDVGVPWMVATDALNARPRLLLRPARIWLARIRRPYRRLVNVVDARNTAAMGWLARLGFTVAETPHPFGPFSLPFHRFELTGEP